MKEQKLASRQRELEIQEIGCTRKTFEASVAFVREALTDANNIKLLFFFLMIRRPPRSTPLSLHDALPICSRASPSARRAAACRAILRPFAHCRSCPRSEEHTSELQSRLHLVCRLLLE